MKIAVVGNLCQNGYILAKALRKLGVDADLYITCKDNQIAFNQNPREYDELPKEVPWIRLFNTTPAWKAFLTGRKIFKRYNWVIALTLSPAYVQFFNKNFISISTGSDLREFIFQKGFYNWLLKRAYKKTSHLFCGISELETAVKKLSLENKTEPIFTPIEVDEFAAKSPIEAKFNETLIIFLPTNWSLSNARNEYNKGSDKFLNACRKLFEKNYDFRVKIIDQSKNPNTPADALQFVKQFINEWSSKIILLEPIFEKEKMVAEYKKSDIVADQFSVGIFGTIGAETLACRKPLLAYFDRKYDKYYDNETPPIINCGTEEEIYQSLKEILEKQNRNEFLKDLGERGYQWIKKFHDIEPFAKKVLNVIQLLRS